MNFIIYFLIGFFLAILGALPLGTVNVAVINTTIKEDVYSALKIVLPAALGELILIFFAILNFNAIQEFFFSYSWLQYLIVVILLVLGVILIFGKKNCIKDNNGECIATKKRFQLSKQLLGFVLGLCNPTVLIYWLFVISFLSSRNIALQLSINMMLMSLFFIGAFSGKVITLYGYGKCSHYLKKKVKGITKKINTVIGCLLVVVAIIQALKILF